MGESEKTIETGINLEEIEKLFNDLGINPNEYPQYNDPYTFSNNLNKFSLLKDIPINYSDSTSCVKIY